MTQPMAFGFPLSIQESSPTRSPGSHPIRKSANSLSRPSTDSPQIEEVHHLTYVVVSLSPGYAGAAFSAKPSTYVSGSEALPSSVQPAISSRI
ncbi:hypothetical protein K505DRAFT_322662 [Melanomma pulvis-pyrius CBS 109.77]|uniref:Uncharacterized protein n=1 Tax=Melanomma pulvis-pyrius CBS 109.77 TaxID=1314802 RepID=A0A6A6XMC2_9PLEO|nr:hypothetical protein K505DRAFT_322662 [Melanomma pulvis-pyrius CBS 109.77]